MQVYIVGGAVRDKLLNRPIKDKDFVVVGATPTDMLQAGFIQVGADFPVFLHPTTKAEYALARTERKSGKGYKGFEVYAAPDVTLEDDLIRRDLTINAMAVEVKGLFDDTPMTGAIVDPYHGQRDINDKILRHVSDAFREDPLRVLRIARFYGRFFDSNSLKNFTIADETLTLIQHIVESGELAHLTPERVWTETSRAMMQTSPHAYFDCLQHIGALPALLPKLATVYKDEHVHTAISNVLQLAGQYSIPLHSRWALLMLSLAPIEIFNQVNNVYSNSIPLGDMQPWLTDIKAIGDQLKVPKKHTQFALLYANTFHYLDNIEKLTAKQLVELIQQTKAHKKTSDLNDLITIHNLLQTVRQRLTMQHLVKTYHQINMNNIDNNLTGSAIGDALNEARINAIDKEMWQK